MHLIKPKQISGEIMTLLEEADEKVIIVSPYYKITKWNKLLNCLNDLKKRKIEIEFYVRENEWESINELKSNGFNSIGIPNLHTKLYLNEKYAIVSSMNLHLSSDTNSLDIALKTESKEEYDELLDYYKRYIEIHSIKILFVKPDKYLEIEKQVSIPHNRPQLSDYNNDLRFSAFQIFDSTIDCLNWRERIASFIEGTFNDTYATTYIKSDGCLSIKTNRSTLVCSIVEESNFKKLKIKMGGGQFLLHAVQANISFLLKETGAAILLPDPNFKSNQIFINYEQHINSNDFRTIQHEDLPIIIKTITCALFILANTAPGIDRALKIKMQW